MPLSETPNEKIPKEGGIGIAANIARESSRGLTIGGRENGPSGLCESCSEQSLVRFHLGLCEDYPGCSMLALSPTLRCNFRSRTLPREDCLEDEKKAVENAYRMEIGELLIKLDQQLWLLNKMGNYFEAKRASDDPVPEFSSGLEG
ncbi:hypothetical protein HZH68_012227 [Vespula germanica]|uniref:Uncharacterized protein n=1 Tax=Vespula germanica TaxID=30212 RepID=A0A834JHR7_VESGE|nr:hypothetical protein HZH68_012227 [Vespula germanica]